MKKTLFLLAFFALFRACAPAQTPPNWLTVTAANIHGGSNALLPAGNLTFTATDNTGAPIGYQAGGGGQMVTNPTSCAVANGAIVGQCLLANVSVSNPSNFCYSATITDANNKLILGGPTSGYQCVQPQTSNVWCAAGNCDFDQYVPNLPAAVTALMPPPTALSLGGVYALSCEGGLVATGIDVTGRLTCGATTGTGNVIGNDLTAGLPLLGAGGSLIAADTANLVALTGVDINTANQVAGLLGRPLPALASGYLNYTGSAWALTNPFASPTLTGTVTITGLANGCLNVTSGVVGSQTCGGGAGNFQINGINIISSATVNYANSAVFNGLTFTFSNPSVGNIQLGASGTLTNAGLQFSSTTVNGQACGLGGTCTLPFQTNGTNNLSQAGLNRVTSTANAVGLTATPVNSSGNQAKIEIAGLLTNAGLQFSATTVNGQACVLGGACNVPFQTLGSGNTSQVGLNFVASSANALGLTVTPANAANQERFEIAGALTNAGLVNPSTNVNGSTCTLGATCTPPATALTTTGSNGTFWGVSGGVQGWIVPAGAGNVNGPGGSTVGHLALFNNTSGTLLSDGGAPGPLATQLTGALATGIAKVTTGTGALSTAIAADFPTLNQSTSGNAATATGLSTTGVNGTFWGVSGGVQGYFTPPGGGNVSGSGLTNNTPLVGAGGTNVQIDTAHLIALTGTDISTSNQVTGLRGAALPALAAGYLNYTGSAWAFTTPVVASPQFQVGVYNNTGTAGVVTGDPNLTENGSVLAYNAAFSPAQLGFGSQADCRMDGNTFNSSQDCADYMEGTLGLRSGVIIARPEIINKNWVTVNFAPDWRPSTGAVNSTVCDDSTLVINSWSIAGNVVTFQTAANTLLANQRVQLNAFGTSTFFNGLYVTVLPAGLTSTQFTAVFVHANGGATESGTFTPNLNCTIFNAPLIFGGSSLIIGTGPVLSAANMSGGTLIKNGQNHPKPVGKPTLGTFTCGGSGGPAGATYHFAVQFDVNLQTKTGNSPVRGPSAYDVLDKTCATGQSTVTIAAPTGGAAGSLAHPEFSVGVASALNGDYYVQQTGANGSMACGVAGTIDSLNDCKTTGNAVITLANIQAAAASGSINGSFPMPADNKAGQSVDITNPGIVTGPNATVTFLEQVRDTALACESNNALGNNPNVLWYNISGQEGEGTNNGTVQMYGACGGYAGFSGAFYYGASQSPNSTLSQITMSGGPTSGANPFYGIIADGRENGAGGASGTLREMNNITIALKGGGTANLPILLQGARTWVGLSNGHFESVSGNESVYVTNGANLVFNHFEGSTTGIVLHIDATAGFVSGVGLCPQGIVTASQPRCQTTAKAVQDDTDGSGIQPLLGLQAHFASAGSNSVIGNQTSTGTCIGCGAIFDHTGALHALSHTISDTCTLGTSCAVTFAGTAVFAGSGTYHCSASDATAANAVRVNQTSGSAVTFIGTGTDVISYTCAGH